MTGQIQIARILEGKNSQFENTCLIVELFQLFGREVDQQNIQRCTVHHPRATESHVVVERLAAAGARHVDDSLPSHGECWNCDKHDALDNQNRVGRSRIIDWNDCPALRLDLETPVGAAHCTSIATSNTINGSAHT